MKTATVEDLKTRLDTIVGWVEQGEDVMVVGRRARQDLSTATVDWSRSAALRRREKETILTQADVNSLFEDLRGPY